MGNDSIIYNYSVKKNSQNGWLEHAQEEGASSTPVQVTLFSQQDRQNHIKPLEVQVFILFTSPCSEDQARHRRQQLDKLGGRRSESGPGL